jgi:hypothetical protein
VAVGPAQRIPCSNWFPPGGEQGYLNPSLKIGKANEEVLQTFLDSSRAESLGIQKPF